MSEARRPCPNCGQPTRLLIARLIYPRSQDYQERAALVCWACNKMRLRGEAWRDIDLRRHSREWKQERKQEHVP